MKKKYNLLAMLVLMLSLLFVSPPVIPHVDAPPIEIT